MPNAETDERMREELAGLTMEELQDILLGMKAQLHNQTDLQDRERLIRKIEIEKARQNSANHSRTGSRKSMPESSVFFGSGPS